ncbi:flagellar basal-body rod protein FlgF [Schwartzia sp. (in: firmicutes)]|nr:flagellar basal-body rod protein FlgF [Schwartzia sp. (in: firmicutes)]
MWRGLYTAATGMITEQNRTAVIANNLANVNTTGYKRDRAIDEEFNPMLIRRINDTKKIAVTDFKGFSLDRRAPIVGTLGLGSYTAEIATDASQGNMMTTGNSLDLAISGNGYFEVQTPQGVRYTRNGNFYRQKDGTIVTSLGQPVLNTGGRPIQIPEDVVDVVIGSKGEIYGNGDMIAQLGFVEFNDRRAVLKQGDSLYFAQEGARPQAATGEIYQGVLERSNSNVVNEMVELINNHRIYEANSKAVVSQDTLLDHAVNDVGRVS